MEKKFLNNKEAAEYLRVKEETMEVWRVRGRGPRFRRAGRRILYAIEDIEAFIGESVGSTSEPATSKGCK
jgi:predicted site-specific integrase-resolvase